MSTTTQYGVPVMVKCVMEKEGNSSINTHTMEYITNQWNILLMCAKNLHTLKKMKQYFQETGNYRFDSIM